MTQAQISSSVRTFDNNTVGPLQSDINGNLKVAIAATGTSAAQVQGAAAQATTTVVNPVQIGGIFTNSWGGVTDGQTVSGRFNATGAQMVSIGGIPSALDDTTTLFNYGQNQGNMSSKASLASAPHYWNGAALIPGRGDVNGMVTQAGLSSTFWNFAAATGGIVNTTVAVTIKTAAGVGVRNYLKTLQVSHDALGAATEIAIRDGAAGAVLWRGKLGIAVNDGLSTLDFDPPLRGTANTLLEFVTLTATVTGGVFPNATGFTGP